MANGKESPHSSMLTLHPRLPTLTFAYQKHDFSRVNKMELLSLRIFHFTFNKTIVITSIATYLPGPMLCALHMFLSYFPRQP